MVDGAHDTLCIMSVEDVRQSKDTSRLRVPEQVEAPMVRIEHGQ